MTKLEEIARAIWADQTKDIRAIGGDYSWEACPSQEAFMAAARAAVEAMREPTGAMLARAFNATSQLDSGDVDELFHIGYRAMIDAILNEKL